MHYPLYVDLRRKYLVVFNNLRDIRSLTPLLGSIDRSKMRAIATYAHHAFKRRQEKMP